MPSFNLSEHLKKEHRRTPFSHYLREIVYGGNDGIVTTFAVVAGFAGAQASPAGSSIPVLAVLLFGLANLIADGLSMSLGSFLSLRADQDVYTTEKLKEAREIEQEPQNEFSETVDILMQKKFSEEDAHEIARLYKKNPAYWVEFMMKDELEMTNPQFEKPLAVASSTFASFVFFGAIPLVPYFLQISSTDVFVFSVGFTVLSLLLLGGLRAYVTRRNIAQALSETLLVGGIAASSAYIVGSFFRV